MKKETIYLSLAMLAMATTPCNAQSEEIKDSTQHLEEVIISTTRIPEIKQNAAATVTILDQKANSRNEQGGSRYHSPLRHAHAWYGSIK